MARCSYTTVVLLVCAAVQNSIHAAADRQISSDYQPAEEERELARELSDQEAQLAALSADDEVAAAFDDASPEAKRSARDLYFTFGHLPRQRPGFGPGTRIRFRNRPEYPVTRGDRVSYPLDVLSNRGRWTSLRTGGPVPDDDERVQSYRTPVRGPVRTYDDREYPKVYRYNRYQGKDKIPKPFRRVTDPEEPFLDDFIGERPRGDRLPQVSVSVTGHRAGYAPNYGGYYGGVGIRRPAVFRVEDDRKPVSDLDRLPYRPGDRPPPIIRNEAELPYQPSLPADRPEGDTKSSPPSPRAPPYDLVLCSDYHSCSSRVWQVRDTRASTSWRERGCMCDPQCINYDDCCRDADALYGDGESYGKLGSPEGGFSCRPVPPLSPAPKETSERSWYMKDACPREVSATARKECEQPRSASSDPLASVPVTSLASGITYRNYACALCHGDTVDLAFWRVLVRCGNISGSATAAQVTEGLRPAGDGGWGLPVGGGRVISCSLNAQPPAEIEPRECVASQSFCPVETDFALDELCRNHTALVYRNGRAFRNIYCLLCQNNEREDAEADAEPQCSRPCGEPEVPSGGRGLRIRLTLRVGADLRCGGSDVWDPFRKICRSVVCAGPGSYLRDGVCVGGQPLESALPASTTPASAEPSTPSVFSPPTTNRLPPIELDLIGDEGQENRRRLARNRALLVENRNRLIRNKDDFIRNKDTDGDRLERTILITERRELIERRNTLIRVRQLLLDQRAQLIARAKAESAQFEGTGLDAELESERGSIGIIDPRRPQMKKDPVLELNLVPKDSFMTNSEIQMETDDFKETNASSQTPDLTQQNKTNADIEILPEGDEEQNTEDDIFYDVLEIEDILSNEYLDSNNITDTALTDDVDSESDSSRETETASSEDQDEITDIVNRLLETTTEDRSTISTKSPSRGVAEEQATEATGDVRDQQVNKPDFTSSPKPDSNTEEPLEGPTEDYPKTSYNGDDSDIIIAQTDRNLFTGDNKKETGNSFSTFDIDIPGRKRPVVFLDDRRYDDKERFADPVFYDSRPLPPVEDITTIGPRNLTVVSYITSQSEPDYGNRIDPEQYDYSDIEMPTEAEQKGPYPGRESDVGTRLEPTGQRGQPGTQTPDDFREPPVTVLSPSRESGTESSQSDRETDEYRSTEESFTGEGATIPTEPDFESYSEEVSTDPSFIGDRGDTGDADARENNRGPIRRPDIVETPNKSRGRFELDEQRGGALEFERREDDDKIIFDPNIGRKELGFEQNRSDDDFYSSKQNTVAENTAIKQDDVRNMISVERTKQRESTEFDQDNRQGNVEAERNEFPSNTTPARGRNPGPITPRPNRRQGGPSSLEQNADRGKVKFTLTRPLEKVTFRPFRPPANIEEILKRRRQGSRPRTEEQEETEVRRPKNENIINDGKSTSKKVADGEQNTVSGVGFTRQDGGQGGRNEQTSIEFSLGPSITREPPQRKFDSRGQDSGVISENPKESEIRRGDTENEIGDAVSLNDKIDDREQGSISETEFTQLNNEREGEPLIQTAEDQEPRIGGTEPNLNAPRDRPEAPQRPPGPSTVRGPPQRKVPTNQISTTRVKTQDSPPLRGQSETSTDNLSSQTQGPSSSNGRSSSRAPGSIARPRGPASRGGTRSSLPFFLRKRGSQRKTAKQNSGTRQSNVRRQFIADDTARPARQSLPRNSSSKRKAASASQKVRTVVKDNDYFSDRESTIRFNQPYSLVAERRSSHSNFNRKYSSRRTHHEERKRKNRQSIRNRRRNSRRNEANFQSKKIEKKLHTTAAVFPTPGKGKYNRINTFHSEEDKHYLYTDDADTFRRINPQYGPQGRDDVTFTSLEEGNLETPNEPSVTPLYDVPLYSFRVPEDQELGNSYAYDARRDDVDDDEEGAFIPQQYSDEEELKAKEYPDLDEIAQNKEYDVEYVDYNPSYSEF